MYLKRYSRPSGRQLNGFKVKKIQKGDGREGRIQTFFSKSISEEDWRMFVDLGEIEIEMKGFPVIGRVEASDSFRFFQMVLYSDNTELLELSKNESSKARKFINRIYVRMCWALVKKGRTVEKENARQARELISKLRRRRCKK